MIDRLIGSNVTLIAFLVAVSNVDFIENMMVYYVSKHQAQQESRRESQPCRAGALFSSP
jgi:hypothetical protein